MTLLNGHNSTKGDNPELRNTGQLFLMRKQSMKFQNPLLKFVRTDKPNAISPSTFPKLGHKNNIPLHVWFRMNTHYLAMILKSMQILRHGR